MKTIIFILLWAVALPGHAELVEVFACITKEFDHPNGRDVDVWYQATKQLGRADTGETAFGKVLELAAASSWQAEPFYGPVVKLMIKDSSGQFFLVHFEYLKGHAILGQGLRFAVAKGSPVKGQHNQWRGDPYCGSSIKADQPIIAELRKIVKSL
ncbi:MAG: hypothetical protein CJBNEKGG_01000 [Prosthecobacter sp.]|nr:hypothetical protein [Prosthecobacter sp.]